MIVVDQILSYCGCVVYLEFILFLYDCFNYYFIFLCVLISIELFRGNDF